METMELHLDCEEITVDIDAEETVATISGLAVPYGVAGYPTKRGGGNPGPVAVRAGAFVEDLQGLDPGVVFCETHDPSASNTLASVSAEGDVGLLSFKDGASALQFVSTVDVTAPKSGQIHSNLKNKIIKGNVSAGFAILAAEKGRCRDVFGKMVDATIVTKAKLDHLAFLGNTTPAFRDAISIAAEKLEDDYETAEIHFKDADGEVIHSETITRKSTYTSESKSYYDDDGNYMGMDEESTSKSYSRVEPSSQPPVMDSEEAEEQIESVEYADPEEVQAALAAHDDMLYHYGKGL